MCVICHKPEGIELPSDETIKKMFKANPHGAGFAIQGDFDGKFKVKFWKGFMDVDSFITAIHSHGDLKNYRVVMHFRIKTSGETDEATTHPFLMSNQFADLRKTEGTGDVLFHNGVFSGLGGLIDPKASDTQDFVVGVAMHHLREARDPSKLHLAIAKEIINSCRVIILHQKKTYPYKKFGIWTQHDDGCEYSNMNWETTIRYNTLGSYTPTRSNTSVDVDYYGCNRAEFAWPTPQYQWINAGTQERFDLITKYALEKTELKEEGCFACKFNSTKDMIWYCYPETLDILTEAHFDDFKALLDDEAILGAYGCSVDDNVIAFMDEMEADEFLAMGEKIDEYEYRICGRTWYLDTVNLIAYTDEGIKEEFKTGEQGHVKKWLKELGTTDRWIAEGEVSYHSLGSTRRTDTDWDEEYKKMMEEDELDPAYGRS